MLSYFEPSLSGTVRGSVKCTSHSNLPRLSLSLSLHLEWNEKVLLFSILIKPLCINDWLTLFHEQIAKQMREEKETEKKR